MIGFRQGSREARIIRPRCDPTGLTELSRREKRCKKSARRNVDPIDWIAANATPTTEPFGGNTANEAKAAVGLGVVLGDDTGAQTYLSLPSSISRHIG